MKTILSLLFLVILAPLLVTSCASNSASSSGSYYAPDPVSPVDRASSLQQGIGAITRSGIR